MRVSRRALSLSAIGVLIGYGAVQAAQDASPTPDVSRCEVVDAKTVAWIELGLTDKHKRTSDATAVRSKDFEKVWFVSFEVDDKPAVWAINSITENGATMSVNDQAKSTTDWFHADETSVKMTGKEDGIAESLVCLSVISDGTPVASPTA